MVQMMQFLHMQGDPFHFLSNVLNSEIFSIVLIPLLIDWSVECGEHILYPCSSNVVNLQINHY